MTFLPPAGRAATSRADGQAQVEYRLVRESVVRDVRTGRIERVDVCDAHPELIRAATNIGRALDERCPICKERSLVSVTYVFGAGLPPGGRCPGTAKEMRDLTRRAEPVLCYEIEVCPACKWHHLMRKYPSGGRAKPAPQSRAKTTGENR